jgi:glycosyltransferase involved in cell wall biosynthesis
MSKKKILTFIDWFLPGYKAGGPIRSMANIVETFQDEYEYYIITRNTDLAEVHPYEDVQPDTWLKVHSANVYYMSSGEYSIKKIRKLMGEQDYDMLYLNSLFSPKFTLVPLMLQKLYFKQLRTVLAPRGMLGEGALKFKSLKKKVFLFFTRSLGFYKGLRWHATTEDEKSRIVEHFGDSNEIRIGQCITLPKQLDEAHKAIKEPGVARFFYIGRLSEHKNISHALEVFSQHEFEGKITLDIFGALEEPDYHDKCMSLIEASKPNVTVEYHGPVPYDDLRDRILHEFHFLLLPTKGESYSHAILDSWGCGCPVLISDQTPWLGLEDESLGWNFELRSRESFVDQVNKALALSDDAYKNMAGACVEFVNSELCKPEIIENNRLVFN